MECVNCSRLAFSKMKCPFCSNNLCSYICLESHLLSNHPINNNTKNVYEKPKIIRIKKSSQIQKTQKIIILHILHMDLLQKI